MWTHASLCQLASELGNGHRHVSYGCSQSQSLFPLQKAFALVVISVCLSLQITRRIHFLCEVRYLSELLTDQGPQYLISFHYFLAFPA